MIPRAISVPRDTLLSRYAGQEATYTDCYEVMFVGDADLGQFITAFYTTWLFRAERLILSLVLRRRIKNSEVSALAKGAETFAAWRVEDRAKGEILLCDLSGRTRSWLAVVPNEGRVTRLLFGSAVVADSGRDLPRSVRLLTPVHKVYSRALLWLAQGKLRKG